MVTGDTLIYCNLRFILTKNIRYLQETFTSHCCTNVDYALCIVSGCAGLMLNQQLLGASAHDPALPRKTGRICSGRLLDNFYGAVFCQKLYCSCARGL